MTSQAAPRSADVVPYDAPVRLVRSHGAYHLPGTRRHSC